MKRLKYMKTYLFFSFIVFFVGCSGNQQPSKSSVNNNSEIIPKSKEIDKNIQKKNTGSSVLSNNRINYIELKIVSKDGILFIVDEENKYILTSSGLDYNVHISNNKKLLVVDILRTNNLQIVELFSKKDTNRFKRVKRRLKKDVWDSYLKNKTYEFKDIENPQLRFYEWVDNDTFELKLSYELKSKIYEETVRYDIYF